MKLFSKLLCGVMLLYASMAFAQGSYTTTTLGAAITSGSATTITVASTSGMSGSLGGNGWGLYVDREFMRIVVVVNSTTLQVIRGMAGTRGANHINGAVVWAGPLNYFTAAIPTGACTVANLTVNPIINTSNGQVYDCDSSTTEWAVQQGVFIPADYCSASTTGTAGTGNNTTILDGSVSALEGGFDKRGWLSQHFHMHGQRPEQSGCDSWGEADGPRVRLFAARYRDRPKSDHSYTEVVYRSNARNQRNRVERNAVHCRRNPDDDSGSGFGQPDGNLGRPVLHRENRPRYAYQPQHRP
jgi:hypothetical protein